MTEAESFWSVKGEQNKDITDDIAPFMAKVICTAGGKMNYLAGTGSLPVETNDSPKSPEMKTTADALDQLAIVLAKSNKLDDLVNSLYPQFEKGINETVTTVRYNKFLLFQEPDSFKRLVIQFAESKQNSVPKIANALLAAHLITEEVTDALNTPPKVSKLLKIYVFVSEWYYNIWVHQWLEYATIIFHFLLIL